MRYWILLLPACLLGSEVWAKPAAKSPPDASPAAKPVFQAGAATATITPPLGLPVVGGFAPFPSKHIHDELRARCLVVDDGRTRLALVVCDLLGVNEAISSEARRRIKELDVGLPPEQVLICATHTHSGSSALGANRFKLNQPADDYQSFVVRRIVDVVQCAVNNLRPAQFAFAAVQAPEHVFNRRWFLKPGTMPPNPFGGIDKVKMNPSGGSANLVEPAGPTDPAVSILALRQPDGKFIAVYSSYSLHYVGGVGPGHISADYYGMYCQRLEQLLQPERQDPPVVVLMSNGTSGDINNINFRQPRPKKQPYEKIREVADDLADKVLDALNKAQYRTEVALAARYREIPIATRHPGQEQVQWAKKTIAERPKQPGKVDLSAIYAERTLQMVDYPEVIPVPLQVLCIGNVCLGTMPCEVFCEIGLEFKKRCPIQPAFLVSLSHGYFGYLPTPRHHELGGYETWLGTNRLEPKASEKMLDALIEMATEIKAGSAK